MRNVNLIRDTVSGLKISWPYGEDQIPGLDSDPSKFREFLERIYDEAATIVKCSTHTKTVELDLTRPAQDTIPRFVYDVIDALAQYFESVKRAKVTTVGSAEIIDDRMPQRSVPVYIGTMQTKDQRWKLTANLEKVICVGAHPLVDVRTVIGSSNNVAVDRFNEDKALEAIDTVLDASPLSNPNIAVSLLNSVFYTQLAREVPLVSYYSLDEIGPLELRRRLSVKEIPDHDLRLVLLPILRNDFCSLLDQVEHVSNVIKADPNSLPPIFITPDEDVSKAERFRWDLCKIYANSIFSEVG